MRPIAFRRESQTCPKGRATDRAATGCTMPRKRSVTAKRAINITVGFLIHNALLRFAFLR